MNGRLTEITDVELRVRRALELIRDSPAGDIRRKYVLLAFVLRRASTLSAACTIRIPANADWAQIATGDREGLAQRLRVAGEQLDAANDSLFQGSLRALCSGESDFPPSRKYVQDRLVKELITLLDQPFKEVSELGWQRAAECLAHSFLDKPNSSAGIMSSGSFAFFAGMIPDRTTLFCGSILPHLTGLNAFAARTHGTTGRLTAWLPESFETELHIARVLAWLGQSDFPVVNLDEDLHPHELRDGAFDCVFGMLPALRHRKARLGRTNKPVPRVDLALLRKMLNHANGDGKVFVLTSKGILFSGGQDRWLREEVVSRDLVEAVVSLPLGMLERTKAASVLLILAKQKGCALKGKVVFINAAEALIADAHMRTLTDQLREIAGTCREWLARQPLNSACRLDQLSPGVYGRTVESKVIKANDHNLDVLRYMAVPHANVLASLNDELDMLKHLVETRNALEANVRKLIDDLSN